jgi:hypothetical protein
LLCCEPPFQPARVLNRYLLQPTIYIKWICYRNFMNTRGVANGYCRDHCDNAFKSLRVKEPDALNSIVPYAVQSFEKRCHRYIQVYEQGLPPHLAEFAVKKYLSHRHVPPEALLVFTGAEFDEINAQSKTLEYVYVLTLFKALKHLKVEFYQAQNCPP